MQSQEVGHGLATEQQHPAPGKKSQGRRGRGPHAPILPEAPPQGDGLTVTGPGPWTLWSIDSDEARRGIPARLRWTRVAEQGPSLAPDFIP